MAASPIEDLVQIVKNDEPRFLSDWISIQVDADTLRKDLLKESELREQSREFLTLFIDAASKNMDVGSAVWESVRSYLTTLSRQRTQRGFSPIEIATFVFSLKQPLFSRLYPLCENNPRAMADGTWAITTLVDKLGLMTTEIFQRTREEIINRQQQDMLELSTPVVKLWDGILALPMIGTLDSGRTQVVMETLLERIVETGAEIAILDITGVPTVDTLVAQHLLKTVTAARLMGADCIISGIRPQIAQTIVHLGVDLENVITKGSLADAFALALKRRGLKMVKDAASRQGNHSEPRTAF